jgi:transposase
VEGNEGVVRGSLEFYYFPSHSPELNPVESGWGVLKCSRLANDVLKTPEDLTAAVERETEKMNEDKELLVSFFNHAELKLQVLKYF